MCVCVIRYTIQGGVNDIGHGGSGNGASVYLLTVCMGQVNALQTPPFPKFRNRITWNVTIVMYPSNIALAWARLTTAIEQSSQHCFSWLEHCDG